MNKYVSVFVVILIISGCGGDPNEQANKLFVEAKGLIELSKNKDLVERWQLLETAETNLREIIKEYPSSNLAVQLSSGQSIGDISLKRVEELSALPKCLKSLKRKCLINQSIKIINNSSIDISKRAHYLGYCAGILSRNRLFDESNRIADQAYEVAKNIPFGEQRDRALSRVASVQAKANNIPQAKGIAFSIYSPNERINALHDIGRAEARSGNVNGAFRTANKLKGISYNRETVLSYIVNYYAKNGAFSKARKLALSLSEEHARTAAIGYIANAYIVKGDINEGLDLLKSIQGKVESFYLSEVIRQIVDAFIELEKFDEASTVAERIPTGFMLYQAYIDIGVAQLKTGHTVNATNSFNKALVAANSSNDQRRIAAAQAYLEQYDDAMTTANSIMENDKKLDLLVRALIYRKAYSLAEKMADSQKNEERRDGILFEMTEETSNNGDFKKAINFANRMKNPVFRAGAYITIAAHLPD